MTTAGNLVPELGRASWPRMCVPLMLSIVTSEYSTPLRVAVPGVTTGFIGTAASCASLVAQNVSKSAGAVEAGVICSGEINAPP